MPEEKPDHYIVHREQGERADQAAGHRIVLTNDRILHGVRQGQQHDAIKRIQLRQFTFAKDALPRVRVAVVSGTEGEQQLAAQEWQLCHYPFVIQACKALQRGDVEAVVYDKTILGHMIKDYGWHELDVLPQTLAVHDYAIALPRGSSFRKPINRALLQIIYDPAWEEMVQRYIEAGDHFAKRGK